MRYRYMGDWLTDQRLKGMQCDPVLRADGKCIRGRNGNMLVVDEQGQRYVVLARLLRINHVVAAAREQTLTTAATVTEDAT